MGSFEEHVRYGVGFYAVSAVLVCGVSAYLLYEGVLTAREAVFAVAAVCAGFPFALAGASFPDIDHHSAKPHRFFKKWMSVATAVVAGYVLLASGLAFEAGAVTVETVEPVDAPEEVVGSGVAVGVAAVAGMTAFVGVGVLKPRHRGVTHTKQAGALVACLIGVVVWYGVSVFAPPVAVFAGAVAGASFFVGFLSHLQCDGLLVGFLPDASG